jgi:hypothetical protein
MLNSLFAHPWLLGALLAATLPWIIEWLFRRRKRQVELPTLRYLLKNKEQENVKRQDRNLLLVRTVAVALLVLAIARPVLQQGLLGANKRNVVIVLDGTASMHQRVGVTTAFSVAQKKAAAMVRSLPADASVAVVTLGDRAETAIEGESDRYTVAGRIESLRAGSGAGAMTDALAWTGDYLKKANWDHAELYFFSDFQKHTWQPAGGKTETLAQAMRDLGNKHEVFLVDVGGAPAFNFMVTTLKPVEKVVTTGKPVTFKATLATTGKMPDGVTARAVFLVDGDKKGARELPLGQAGGTVEFEHRFASAGEYLVEVQVEGDTHPIDNRRQYLCQVPESIQVLIVDENAGAPLADTYFISRAIDPLHKPGTEKVSIFSIKTIAPSQLSFENLEPYRVLVCSALSTLNEALAARLERYVSEGGSAWFFLGPKASPFEYNKYLFKDGRGVLPAKLADASTAAQPGSHLVYTGAQSPVFASLQGSAGKTDAQFMNFIKLTPAEGSTSVLASLSTGEPVFVRRDFGRGQAVLACATAGPEWTLLPALPEYPILVQEMLKGMAGDPDASVNLEAGERFNSPVYVSSQHLLLKRPDGSKERLTPKKKEGQEEAWSIAYERTDMDGEYAFSDVANEVLARRRFVVNPRTEEGDLTRLQQSEFKDVFGSASWRWLGPEQSVEDFASKLHSVLELAPYFLLVLAALLGLESYFAVSYGKRRSENPA